MEERATLTLYTRKTILMSTTAILLGKLGREGDLERVRAVREAAPNTRLVIDANTGWSFAQLCDYLPELAKLGVEMVEQPLSSEEEHLLETITPALPITADESCIDRTSLASLKGRYQAVNIKLDKTGGMTEALALLKEAQDMGFEVMVGCMIGTSLAMAPALLLAQVFCFTFVQAFQLLHVLIRFTFIAIKSLPNR